MNDCSIAKLMYALHYRNVYKKGRRDQIQFWELAVELYVPKVRARVMAHAFQYLTSDTAVN